MNARTDRIRLPPPSTRGRLTLEETLARRRSVREFDPRPLTMRELSQLLWAAQGVTGPEGDRTAPSAGGLQPLEAYLGTADGLFHYRPRRHLLERRSGEDPRQPMFESGLLQESLRKAPAVFVIAAVYQRTVARYGRERSPRYVHMEAGHAAQNLLLQAVSLDLGAVVIGAFEDQELHQALALPADHRPLYLIPVGAER